MGHQPPFSIYMHHLHSEVDFSFFNSIAEDRNGFPVELSQDHKQSTLNVLVISAGGSFYTKNKLAAAKILEKKLRWK